MLSAENILRQPDSVVRNFGRAVSLYNFGRSTPSTIK